MNARRLLLPLLSIVGLLIASCGGPSGGTAGGSDAASQGGSATAAPAAGNIEMRMAWWGSQDRHDRTIKVIELFQKENPNVHITYEFSAFDAYWTKLTTEAAGKNLPCLIQQDYQKIGEWVSRDLLLPLDSYTQDGTINVANVNKSNLDGGRLNGKIYAISLGTNSQTLILDTGLFQKAGVAIPDSKWTWDDFEKTATQLKEKLGIYGMSIQLDDVQVFKLWLKQHGKLLYNAEGNALGYDDDKLYIDFFTMIKRMQDNGIMPARDTEVTLVSAPLEENPLVKQQAAMGYMWSNQVIAVAGAASGRTFQTTMMPRTSASAPSGSYLKPSQFFSITSQCEHPEIAAKLIDMFTNSIPANEILAAERGVPISSEVRKAIEPKISDAQKQAFSLVSMVEQDASPLDPPDPAGNSEVVSKYYTPLMEQVLFGKLAPEDAAKQFREQANAILGKNK